jgi:hypothetical protein
MDHTHEVYLLDLPQNRPTRRCPVSLRMRSDSRSGLFKAVHNVHPPTRIGTFARSPNFRTAVPVADIVRAFRPNEVKGFAHTRCMADSSCVLPTASQTSRRCGGNEGARPDRVKRRVTVLAATSGAVVRRRSCRPTQREQKRFTKPRSSAVTTIYRGLRLFDARKTASC